MAINFNSLPQEKPASNFVIPKGQYEGVIKKAEMKQPKDDAKPQYLSVEIEALDTVSGASAGKIWAIFTESEAALPRYQLSRLIKALNLPITGEFELKDLTKVIVNKKMLVDIVPEERTDGKAPQRSVVDVNSGEIFYPIEAVPAIATAPDTIAEMDIPFEMPPITEPNPVVHSQY